jgi:hypothetical protein
MIILRAYSPKEIPKERIPPRISQAKGIDFFRCFFCFFMFKFFADGNPVIRSNFALQVTLIAL